MERSRREQRVFRFLVLVFVVGGGGITAGYLLVGDWALAALIAAIALAGAAISDETTRSRRRAGR